jgi:DNA-binding PadR family transcriptional regulator
MIKKIEDFDQKSLMASKELREVMNKTENDLVRGISNLLVLSIISQHGEEGIYGYKIIKEIKEQMKNINLELEEGALYPLLRKLKEFTLLRSEQKTYQGRNRTYYILTTNGQKIYNRMAGLFTKITEALSPMMDVAIEIRHDKYYYCPLCANKIDIKADERFCSVCGHNVYEDLKNRREKQ